MSVEIQFLGASGTVTGSKFLVNSSKYNILVDCGMFQGQRNWREKNWEKPPLAPEEIDAVLITHAHIDHIGMLPRFYRQGLKCPIYLTPPTAVLARLLLLDSGKLQEEEAEYRRRKHKSRHENPQPLYTAKDAEMVLPFFKHVSFHKRHEIFPAVKAEWRRMGHIAGAASIRLEIEGRIINFSGDVGRYSVPILKDPEPSDYGDLLLIESTYGDRQHEDQDTEKKLAEIIRKTHERRGIVIIPSFAVGRAQQLLYYLRDLKAGREIPDLPVIIDSPMAKEATEVYKYAINEYDQEAREIYDKGTSPFAFSKLYFTKDRDESIKLNSIDEPMIIIAASGMLSGGRILHHLKNRISDPRNTVLFVGYQPPGGRGDWIKSGAETVRLIGEDVPIRAEIEEISMLSAHGDRNELLRWCKSGSGKPGKVAVVHGEPGSAGNFRNTLQSELKWDAFTAAYLQKVTV